MANCAKTASTKGRETKLGKKSKEELIQIVLKKDKIENKLSSQINSLKIENKALQNRVNSFDKDQEGNVKAIAELRDLHDSKVKAIAEMKDRNKSLMEVITSNKVQLEELNQEINTYTIIAAEARDKVKALKAVVCLLGAIAFVLTLILIF